MSPSWIGQFLQTGLSWITWEIEIGTATNARPLTLQPSFFITYYKNRTGILLALKILKIYICSYIKFKLTSKHALSSGSSQDIFDIKYLLKKEKKYSPSFGKRKINTVCTKIIDHSSSISRRKFVISLYSQDSPQVEYCYLEDVCFLIYKSYISFANEIEPCPEVWNICNL